MLRRSLDGLVDEATFAAAGIDGRRRAEELGIEEWGKLSACRRLITS
jgi:16S rRNA A1518/A1519 N6-dimethyltransferase RsmA/KsgA/DIM1 with predicted DNA glycosylase/AP lyase activity